MQFRIVASMVGALALGPLAATPVLAADAAASPQFNIMGPSRCSAWPKSNDITSASKAVPLNWALGFLSGWAAQANLALLDVVDPQEVNTWLTTYCQANPTTPLPLAVRELERDLEAKLPPPPAPATSPQGPMFTAPTPTTTVDEPAARAKPRHRAPAHRAQAKPAAAPQTPAKPAAAPQAPAKPAAAAPNAKPAAPKAQPSAKPQAPNTKPQT
jgi:hypothetical protein